MLSSGKNMEKFSNLVIWTLQNLEKYQQLLRFNSSASVKMKKNLFPLKIILAE
jgi:hypothetical protein